MNIEPSRFVVIMRASRSVRLVDLAQSITPAF